MIEGLTLGHLLAGAIAWGIIIYFKVRIKEIEK